jgi:hypothetical protein
MEKPKKSCCKGNIKVENIISTGNTELIKDTTNNFKLRSDLGVSRITFDNGLYISQNEAADEVCIGFLAANLNRISMFEKYPENWKELITQNETENE